MWAYRIFDRKWHAWSNCTFSLLPPTAAFRQILPICSHISDSPLQHRLSVINICKFQGLAEISTSPEDRDTLNVIMGWIFPYMISKLTIMSIIIGVSRKGQLAQKLLLSPKIIETTKQTFEEFLGFFYVCFFVSSNPNFNCIPRLCPQHMFRTCAFVPVCVQYMCTSVFAIKI